MHKHSSYVVLMVVLLLAACAVPATPPPPTPQPAASLTIKGVRVTPERIVVTGVGDVPSDACVQTQLLADGETVAWWPAETCASLQNGTWEMSVPLSEDDAPDKLNTTTLYTIRAWLRAEPSISHQFAFDLAGPPTPAPTPDLGLLLPESAKLLHRASADLDRDGQPEEVVVAGWGGGPNRLGYDFVELFVIQPTESGYAVAWNSGHLKGERAEPLRVEDVTGDGRPEVLSVQAVGAAGETMYVLTWAGGSFELLRPRGGYFEGGNSFGEVGAWTENIDNDKASEIFAAYGPAASRIDVYDWSGDAYVYLKSLDAGRTHKHFSELFAGNPEAISRIVMLDGNTGEIHETTDEAQIADFVDFLETLAFSRQADQSPRAGYLYWVDLYAGDTKLTRITFTQSVAQIDRVYYDLNRDVAQDLHAFYESLDR